MQKKNRCRRILCGHWRFYLEENEKNGTVFMKIRGIGADGGWVLSSPVTEIYVTDFGLEVWTENPEEVYGLRMAGYGWWSLKRSGMWGKERKDWEKLVQKLPKKKQIFAWMWQDPLCNYIEEQESAAENIRAAEKWKKRHQIEVDSDSLYTIALCLSKAGQTRQWMNHRECPVVLHPRDIFLCFHEDKTGFYETWSSQEYHRKWGYACMETEDEKEPVICARSRWTWTDSPETLDISVSYHVWGEDRVELVKAVYRQTGPDGTIWGDRGAERMARPYIYLCNTGENPLIAGGIIEETWLYENDFVRVSLEEAENE